MRKHLDWLVWPPVLKMQRLPPVLEKLALQQRALQVQPQVQELQRFGMSQLRQADRRLRQLGLHQR